jgi:benzoyl-CoA reductase/2-hydroxyglutaryl-CoA dehydratase subunit BcrC/BadD/HgdB
MKYWHPILDETKSELDRYMAAYDAIHIKYTKALEQIEDLKFENKRSKDIDDDVRYMSRLKKENSEDYADTLIAETAKTFSVSELELKKQLKEKRAIALQNLSGITE